MEIERKFLIDRIPYDLNEFRCRQIEQAYLNTAPVVRIRQDNEEYYLTYKSKGFLVREEYNLPLDRDSYMHLREKADGIIITKKRYEIPYLDRYTIELDIFEGHHAGLILAEVEFASTDDAEQFPVPDWFFRDVTSSPEYCNSHLSKC